MTTTAHPYEGRTIRVNSWHELICVCGSLAEKTDDPALRHCYREPWHWWRFDPERREYDFAGEGHEKP